MVKVLSLNLNELPLTHFSLPIEGGLFNVLHAEGIDLFKHYVRMFAGERLTMMQNLGTDRDESSFRFSEFEEGLNIGPLQYTFSCKFRDLNRLYGVKTLEAMEALAVYDSKKVTRAPLGLDGSMHSIIFNTTALDALCAIVVPINSSIDAYSVVQR